jgi:hypothetical protein
MSAIVMRRIAVVMALGLGACHWGTRPKDLPVATAPGGARVAVRLSGESSDRVGELFAVDSVGVTIFDGVVRRVSWARLSAMDVPKLGGDYDVRIGESVDADKRARLALLSRFPQGMSPALLRSVLAFAKQASLEEIR